MQEVCPNCKQEFGKLALEEFEKGRSPIIGSNRKESAKKLSLGPGGGGNAENQVPGVRPLTRIVLPEASSSELPVLQQTSIHSSRQIDMQPQQKISVETGSRRLSRPPVLPITGQISNSSGPLSLSGLLSPHPGTGDIPDSRDSRDSRVSMVTPSRKTLGKKQLLTVNSGSGSGGGSSSRLGDRPKVPVGTQGSSTNLITAGGTQVGPNNSATPVSRPSRGRNTRAPEISITENSTFVAPANSKNARDQPRIPDLEEIPLE